MSCSATGDELQSGVKILFFCIVKLSKSLSSVHPSLCLRSAFASGSLVLRFKSVSIPFLRIGWKWDLQRICKGITRELLRRQIKMVNLNVFCVIYLAISNVLLTFALRKSEENRRVKPKQGKNG